MNMTRILLVWWTRISCSSWKRKILGTSIWITLHLLSTQCDYWTVWKYANITHSDVLVPRPTHVQFLISYNMQKWRGKAWFIYHMNDGIVYLGRQRGEGLESIYDVSDINVYLGRQRGEGVPNTLPLSWKASSNPWSIVVWTIWPQKVSIKLCHQFFCKVNWEGERPAWVAMWLIWITWCISLCSEYRPCACMGMVRILYLKVYDFSHTHRHFVGQ